MIQLLVKAANNIGDKSRMQGNYIKSSFTPSTILGFSRTKMLFIIGRIIQWHLITIPYISLIGYNRRIKSNPMEETKNSLSPMLRIV